MLVDPQRLPKVLELYLEITQYPILADEIRARMRSEIFARGVISRDDFEREVEEKAVLSQEREGVSKPLTEEPADVWNMRLGRVRDQVTDFYFAHNLPHERFQEIVEEVLGERVPSQEVVLTYVGGPNLLPHGDYFCINVNATPAGVGSCVLEYRFIPRASSWFIWEGNGHNRVFQPNIPSFFTLDAIDPLRQGVRNVKGSRGSFHVRRRGHSQDRDHRRRSRRFVHGDQAERGRDP